MGLLLGCRLLVRVWLGLWNVLLVRVGLGLRRVLLVRVGLGLRGGLLGVWILLLVRLLLRGCWGGAADAEAAVGEPAAGAEWAG
ncbi:hypothetical protein, partial [Streptomyces sp. SID5471]|uniref:hypothetical protein n=1 Tax=Streptomyces sp. SID5471 TaxID=2690298 RepID=UPI001F46FCDA